MRVLVDTQVVLWMAVGSQKLKASLSHKHNERIVIVTADTLLSKYDIDMLSAV